MRTINFLVLAGIVLVADCAPATQYLNPYPAIDGPFEKTMVVANLPSRASSRPYTPIFEEGQESSYKDAYSQSEGAYSLNSLQFPWYY